MGQPSSPPRSGLRGDVLPDVVSSRRFVEHEQVLLGGDGSPSATSVSESDRIQEQPEPEYEASTPRTDFVLPDDSSKQNVKTAVVEEVRDSESGVIVVPGVPPAEETGAKEVEAAEERRGERPGGRGLLACLGQWICCR